MHEKKKEIIVKESDNLLNTLTHILKDLSKSKIKSLIKYQNVLVNDQVETNSSKMIDKGSTLIVYFNKRTTEDLNIKILYEDNDLIAIDKPSGLLSVSTSNENKITAYRLVSDHIKKTNNNAKIYVVHRLDQNTSGVLLFAKNKKIQQSLQNNWQNLVKTREYICVVYGKTLEKGRIESYLKEDNFQKVYSVDNAKYGKFSITNYERLKYKNNYSLLRVLIKTGRKNQIRAHVSEIGHSIVGDKKYGAKTNPINRLALHASELAFIDPRNNKLLKIISNVPQNILNLVE